VIVVDDAVMDRVSFADDFAKGSPIAVSAVVPRELGLSLAVGAGLHTVLDPARIAANSVIDDGLFPSMPLVQGTARLHGLLNRDVDVDIDLAFGSVPSTRTVDGGPLGTIRYDERVDQLQAGVGVMWVPPLGGWGGVDDVTARLGVRGAGYLFTHTFTGEVRPSGLEQQSYLTFTPGIGVDVGWSPLPHAHLEVGARAHYLPYTVDELRHLVVGEAFASVWLDL
jgi:hypothetical protein